eukprot:Skav218772  [mRNA]  locus=scaffold1372:340995:342750:- [translate_table: standard]
MAWPEIVALQAQVKSKERHPRVFQLLTGEASTVGCAAWGLVSVEVWYLWEVATWGSGTLGVRCGLLFGGCCLGCCGTLLHSHPQRLFFRLQEAELFAMKRQLQAMTQQNSPSGARLQESSGQPLSVIIPMGGSGVDFAEAGFRMPKPLVNIVGRPVLMWVLDYLSVGKDDSIFLAVPAPILKQYDIKKMLTRMLPQALSWDESI